MRALAVLVTVLLGGSCTEDIDDPNAMVMSLPPRFAEGYELLTDQPFGRRFNHQAVLVTRDRHMHGVWRHYLLGGSVPKLKEGKEVALFVGTTESGTCPIEIEDVEVTADGVDIRTAPSEGECTADAHVRTFAFLFRSEDTPAVGGEVDIQTTQLEIEDAGALLR